MCSVVSQFFLRERTRHVVQFMLHAQLMYCKYTADKAFPIVYIKCI